MARRITGVGVLALVWVLAFGAGRALAEAEPTLLEPEKAADFVTVDDVVFEEGRVSGVIANQRSHPLRDVRLAVSHVYRWPSEFRPGESPNQAEIITVEEEIPAGSRKPFSATLRRPSPPRSGGGFVTQVKVIAFTEVIPPDAPSVASPGRMR